jgi:hypothetical protein
MSSAMFFIERLRRLESDNTKITIDNASLENVKLKFSPPNTMPLIQPFHMGVINYLKAKCRAADDNRLTADGE